MKKQVIRFTKGELKLFRKLDKVKQEIDEEEKLMSLLNQEKEKKSKNLSELISQISTERIKITKLLEQKQREDEKKLLNLVIILEKVKPNLLGPLLEEIDHDLYIAIAEKMKPKILAKALKHMSKERAIKLNEKFLTKQN